MFIGPVTIVNSLSVKT